MEPDLLLKLILFLVCTQNLIIMFSTAYELTDSDIIGRGGTSVRPRSRKGYENVLSLGKTDVKHSLQIAWDERQTLL
jgi:hypothetical protein